MQRIVFSKDLVSGMNVKAVEYNEIAQNYLPERVRTFHLQIHTNKLLLVSLWVIVLIEQSTLMYILYYDTHF